jgi:hypothetical protein
MGRSDVRFVICEEFSTQSPGLRIFITVANFNLGRFPNTPWLPSALVHGAELVR